MKRKIGTSGQHTDKSCSNGHRKAPKTQDDYRLILRTFPLPILHARSTALESFLVEALRLESCQRHLFLHNIMRNMLITLKINCTPSWRAGPSPTSTKLSFVV